jgi:hypothetical protein
MNHWFLVFWLSWAASIFHHSDLFETETCLTILTLDQHDPCIWSCRTPHRFFISLPFASLLEFVASSFKSQSPKHYMGPMTAFGWISVNQCPTTQVQRKKERKKELISH